MNIEPKWTWKSQATNQDIKGGNIYQVRAKAMTRKRIYMNQNIEEGHKATVFPIRVYICGKYMLWTKILEEIIRNQPGIIEESVFYVTTQGNNNEIDWTEYPEIFRRIASMEF